MLWKFQSSHLCQSSASSGRKTMGGKALVQSYPSRFTAAISRRPRRTWKRHCGHTSKLFSATAKWQLEHSSVKSSAQDRRRPNFCKGLFDSLIESLIGVHSCLAFHTPKNSASLMLNMPLVGQWSRSCPSGLRSAFCPSGCSRILFVCTAGTQLLRVVHLQFLLQHNEQLDG